MNPESNKELEIKLREYVKRWEMDSNYSWDEFTKDFSTIFVSRSAIKEWAESMKQEKPKRKCMNLENHTFGNCFQCVKIDGYNQALQDLLTFLSNKG